MRARRNLKPLLWLTWLAPWRNASGAFPPDLEKASEKKYPPPRESSRGNYDLSPAKKVVPKTGRELKAIEAQSCKLQRLPRLSRP